MARAARATVALALRADRLPDDSVPACRQHAALPEGSVMGRAGPACHRFVRYYRNPVFRALFHALPENRLVRDRHTRLAAAAILSRSARRSRLPDLLRCNSGLLIPWFLDRVSGSAEGTWHYGSTTQEGRKDGPHAGRMGRRGSPRTAVVGPTWRHHGADRP